MLNVVILCDLLLVIYGGKYIEASPNDCPVMIQASIPISPPKNFQRFRIITRTTLFAIPINK